MSVWGLLIILPSYATVESSLTHWDKFTVLNIKGTNYQNRYWVTAFSAYVYASYFCLLLYIEYDTFSTQRLAFISRVRNKIKVES